jgi:NAD+ kinase
MAVSSRTPLLAFVSAATPTARAARASLEKRYGAVKPADADIIVALGGDGLMLQALHRNITRTPIYGMNLGTVGFLLNTYKEFGLLQRLKRARQVT